MSVREDGERRRLTYQTVAQASRVESFLSPSRRFTAAHKFLKSSKSRQRASSALAASCGEALSLENSTLASATLILTPGACNSLGCLCHESRTSEKPIGMERLLSVEERLVACEVREKLPKDYSRRNGVWSRVSRGVSLLILTVISQWFQSVLCMVAGVSSVLVHFLPPSHPLSLALSMVLSLTFLVRVTDACSTRPSPKPRPPRPYWTTADPADPNYPSRNCSEDYRELFCLHNGTCYMQVNVNGVEQSYCHCPHPWYGHRCSYKSYKETYFPVMQRRIETAAISVAVTFIVMVACVISVVVYIYRRRKKYTGPSYDEADGVSGSGISADRPFSIRRNDKVAIMRKTKENFPRSQPVVMPSVQQRTEDAPSVEPASRAAVGPPQRAAAHKRPDDISKMNRDFRTQISEARAEFFRSPSRERNPSDRQVLATDSPLARRQRHLAEMESSPTDEITRSSVV